jgi:hypothetical protein
LERIDVPVWAVLSDLEIPGSSTSSSCANGSRYRGPALGSRRTVGNHTKEGSMDKKGLFIVMARVRPEDEEAFNKWYNEDHLPKALERFPGVLSGRRYKILEGEEEYRYLAIYEFESYATMHATVHSEVIEGLVREYDAAFGKGGRKRILAEQLKALSVG